MFITLFLVLGGFSMLFVDGLTGTGFGLMLIGPVIARLLFEMLYVFFSLHGLLGEANRTLTDIKQIMRPDSERPVRRSPAGESAGEPRQAARQAAPRYAEPAEAPRRAAPREGTRTCPFCGKEVRRSSPFCTNCGSRF